MEYKWRRQPAGRIEAQAAGEYLEGLERRGGKITPELLVREASDENALLHTCFEWDDSKAAHQYRLQQAGKVIREITITETNEKGEAVTVRAFVANSELDEDDNDGYISIRQVSENEHLQEQYRQAILKELKEIKHKLKQFEEFAEVVKAIEAVSV